MTDVRYKVALIMVFTMLLLSITLTIREVLSLKAIYEYVTVKGVVVDAYNRCLVGVEVKVLNQYSGIVTITNTSSDGTFLIVLHTGNYFLEFIKRGYEYKKVSLNLPGTSREVNLGKIELRDGIYLMLDLNNISIEEFKSANIKLIINNISPFEEVCTLSVMGSNNITTYFKYENVKVSSIEVPSMGSRTVYLIIEPIDVKEGTYELHIMLNYSVGVISDNLSIVVEKPKEKVINVEHPIVRGVPGDIISTWITISNPFDVDVSFMINVDVPDVNWAYDILDQNGKTISSITLSPNEKIKIRLRLYVPTDIHDGTYRVILEVSAFEYPVNYSKEILIIVKRGNPIIRMTINTPFLKGYPGSTVKYRMILENVGDAEGLVSINVTGLPKDFSYQIKDLSGNVVSKILIGAGEVGTYLIEVQIPPDVEPTTLLMKVVATCLNNTYEEEIGLSVLGKYEMKYVTENYFVKINAGSTGTFSLTVKNTGYNTLTDVKVNIVDYPSDFNISVVPDRVNEIKPGDSVTFSIYIDVPPDVDSGDYYIIINVSSSQLSIDKRAIHVEVLQTSHALYYALGILSTVIVILIVVYKLFGRR